MPLIIAEKFLPKDQGLPLVNAPGKNEAGEPAKMAIITGSTTIADITAITATEQQTPQPVPMSFPPKEYGTAC